MICGVALLLFQHAIATDVPNAGKNPHTSSADVALGQKLYGGRCAGCHGPLGDGGKGTNLAVPMLSRSQTDTALYRVIRYGLPDTEMPSHNLTPREIWQIAAFVRTLGRLDTEASLGNAERGAALVRGDGGCLGCHVLNGEGGHLGPSLTDVGNRRGPAYLRSKLLDPGRDISSMVNYVQLKTTEGRKVTGVRMNEDSYSIQLRNLRGTIYSFWKNQLSELSVEPRSLMPSYRDRLKAEQIEDIVAYLAGKGGRP